MSKMLIEIDVPDDVNNEELKTKFAATAARIILEQTALRLYQDGEVTTGTAAHMLGMTLRDFIAFLGRHGVSIFHYEEGELEAELSGVRGQER